MSTYMYYKRHAMYCYCQLLLRVCACYIDERYSTLTLLLVDKSNLFYFSISVSEYYSIMNRFMKMFESCCLSCLIRDPDLLIR